MRRLDQTLQRLTRATMNERRPTRCPGMSARHRQMLIAAYLPVVAFGSVFVAARMWGAYRDQLHQKGPR